MDSTLAVEETRSLNQLWPLPNSDNGALCWGPLRMDDGMKGCFLMRRATGLKGIRHAKHKHNVKPRAEMNPNGLVNRFARHEKPQGA